jgi:hypothetical protein
MDSERSAEMRMKKSIKTSDLHEGPIRHRLLPVDFVARIRKFKAILGDVNRIPLEDLIDSFKRDAHPENELAVWERIASTFQLYLSQNPTADPILRKEIYAVLVAASMGADDWSKIKHLSDEKIQQLVMSYRGL